ncbi:MAG: cyclase family protein [Verrucomicrobia bacterium]|nr:cyclase family protein [Verrucomicrobiota bacterium]
MTLPRLVDLTLPLTPGQRGVAVEPKYTFVPHGWNAATWHLYSHAGTHMDTQIHSAAGPETIDTKPLSLCLGPASVANLTPVAPGTLLTVAHLGSLATTFTNGESLLLRTDWYRHAANPAIYRDGLPRISDELAAWCVAHRVKILGVEPPSIADVNHLPEVIRIHQLLLRGGVTIVEGLAHLDQLTQPRVFFHALPLKLAGGDGCPVRAFAYDSPPDTWPRA